MQNTTDRAWDLALSIMRVNLGPERGRWGSAAKVDERGNISRINLERPPRIPWEVPWASHCRKIAEVWGCNSVGAARRLAAGGSYLSQHLRRRYAGILAHPGDYDRLDGLAERSTAAPSPMGALFRVSLGPIQPVRDQ